MSLDPYRPARPLIWPDAVYDLQEALRDVTAPVYIVGGAVRDAYLHRPIHDLDLATPGDAIGLARRIANRLGGDFFVLDAERGVARALIDLDDMGGQRRLVLDVARLRGDLLADLTDRDFTLNAIAVELQRDLGQVIDPLGGIADLDARLIRHCSKSALPDDPIRALRAVRQSVELNARLEAETRAAVRAAGPRLHAISPERVRDELIKLLSVPRPAAALRVAVALELLPVVIPEVETLRRMSLSPPHRSASGWEHTLLVVDKLDHILAVISPRRDDHLAAAFQPGMIVMSLDRFRRQLQKHTGADWPNQRPHRALLLLAALLHHSAESLTERAAALRLSNDEIQRLTAIVRGGAQVLDLPQRPADLALHRFWREFDAAGVDAALLALADHLGTVGSYLNQDEWLGHIERARILLEAYYERYEEVVAPPPLLDGHALMTALDLQPGPKIGTLLTLIREGQVSGEIATVADALRAARQHLAGE
jgi:tRNA nucleotidyltransferase/poly(A) polymerase